VLDELGRAAGSASRLHDLAVNQIAFSIPDAAARLNLSEVTIGKAANHLHDLGIAREVTGRARNRLYVYREYLDILQEGTEEEPG
jgi:Fic family protein